MQIENISEANLIQQIGNNAVRKAQQKSLENGIPNVYSKNGHLYYQLANGKITMKNPFEESSFKEKFKLLIEE